MTKIVTHVTSLSATYLSPSLSCERDAVMPCALVKIDVFCNAAGHMTRFERETVADDISMLDALGRRELEKVAFWKGGFTTFEAIDATGRAIGLADFFRTCAGAERLESYMAEA